MKIPYTPLINEKKSYDYLSGLVAKVVQRVEQGNAVAQPMAVEVPQNIATQPAPPKADAV